MNLKHYKNKENEHFMQHKNKQIGMHLTDIKKAFKSGNKKENFLRIFLFFFFGALKWKKYWKCLSTMRNEWIWKLCHYKIQSTGNFHDYFSSSALFFFWCYELPCKLLPSVPQFSLLFPILTLVLLPQQSTQSSIMINNKSIDFEYLFMLRYIAMKFYFRSIVLINQYHSVEKNNESRDCY